MDEKQAQFLHLAVIEGMKYDDIEKELGIPRKELSFWWETLKDERVKLAKTRDIWKSKFKNKEINFEEFNTWYNQPNPSCYYCKITQAELDKIWVLDHELTKRARGKKLEIDRKKPNESYSVISNLVFSCYWCNNAKTDTFTEEEFKKIGNVIEVIWKNRLNVQK